MSPPPPKPRPRAAAGVRALAAAGLAGSACFLVFGERKGDAIFAVLLSAITARVLVLDVAERLEFPGAPTP